MEIQFSKTAYQSGYGSDKWKKVCGLTKEDKRFIASGGMVFFQASRPSGGGNGTGTYWRVVEYKNGYYNPRVPTSTHKLLLLDDEENLDTVPSKLSSLVMPF